MLYYEDDSVTIYHGDCREIIPTLPSVDLVLTDPPYGIGVTGMQLGTGSHKWHRGEWDNDRPDLRPVLIAAYHCIWGGNYFTDQLEPVESWLVWIKRSERFDSDRYIGSFSVVEMAWTDYGGKPKTKHHNWDGGMRAGDSSNRDFLHPTQKPLELMRWCISGAPNDPQIILDPFMGSGTTLRAAKDLGRKAIGIEIEERYCEIAAKRMSQSVMALEV